MKLSKLKRTVKNVRDSIILYFSFPHIWICLIITILAITTLILSIKLEQNDLSYWASILSNIFAGLITGLIICLLSGIKQITVSKLNNKKKWLTHLRDVIKIYINLHSELVHKSFSNYDGTEELFNFIYDIACRANDINQDILQSTFNKTLSFNSEDYCKKHLNYDAFALLDEFNNLHEEMYDLQANNPTKKDILRYFEKVDKALRRLSSATYHKLEEIEIRLEAFNRSII